MQQAKTLSKEASLRSASLKDQQGAWGIYGIKEQDVQKHGVHAGCEPGQVIGEIRDNSHFM